MSRFKALVGGFAALLTVGVLWFAVASRGAAPGDQAACDIRSMSLSFGPKWSEKTQQETVTVRLTGRARRACVVAGYPAVSLYDKRGQKLPFHYSHRGDQMVTSHRPTRLTVHRGDSVFFVLNQQTCDQGPKARATDVRVGLPGSTATRLALIPTYFPAIYYCRGLQPASFRFVTVSPVVRRLADASSAS